MKRALGLIAILPALILLCFGCTRYAGALQIENTKETANPPTEAANSADMFTDRDFRTTYKGAVIHITLGDDAISCDSNAVKISGTTVHITEEATYVISGTLADGMIVVNAADTAKLQLVLNGADITSATSAPLYILEADKVFVTLAEGTQNYLTNGGEFTAIDDNNIDGAVFSKQDLTINGAGSLTVTSPAGHGIVCKDDLVFTCGHYTIGASSHGLDANDSVRVTGVVMDITAGKDGIHAEHSDDDALGYVYISDGALTISSEGDGVSAGSDLQIENGAFHITAGGGSQNGTKANSGNYGGFMGGSRGSMGRSGGNRWPSSTSTEESASMKGLKAAGKLQISDGSFEINSADDAIHTDGSAVITAGVFEIASGDDAIHAEDTLTISGGAFHINESYEGLEALHIVVSGGDISLTASDDGLNAAGGNDASGTGGRDQMFGRRGGMSAGNGSIVISGGTLHIHASGDGIDANGTLEITGGNATVCGPIQGDTATLDYDRTGVISGGTFIGTGAAGMAQTFSSSENQGVIAVRVGNQSAGAEIRLYDPSGQTILSHTPELPFSLVILSCPDIKKGETYTITIGAASGDFVAY